MRTVFELSDYRDVLKQCFVKRGSLRSAAGALRIDSGYLSRVQSGQSDLTPEQALSLSRYFKFTVPQTKYFLLLVQRARAGTAELGAFLDEEIAEARTQGLRASSDFSQSRKIKELSPELKAAYYSNWIYLAVGMATDIPGLNTTASISKRLGLKVIKVEEVLDFLVRHGLCRRDGKKYFYQGSTYLEKDSPIVGQHLSNWRLRSIENFPHRTKEDYHTSAVTTVSHRDRQKILEILQDARARVIDVAKDSAPEALVCLNLDWFEVTK